MRLLVIFDFEFRLFIVRRRYQLDLLRRKGSIGRGFQGSREVKKMAIDVDTIQ